MNADKHEVVEGRNLGAELICRVLEIAPRTHCAAMGRVPSARALNDVVLSPQLFDLWKNNFQVYGVRKLWKAARRAGISISRDQTTRLVRRSSTMPIAFYGRVSPTTCDRMNLSEDLGRALVFLDNAIESVVIDSVASVVRMIGIGRKLGYKKTVLVGVDLSNTRYLWETPSFVPASVPTPVNNQRHSVRETNLRQERPFILEEMIVAGSQAVVGEGGRVEVASGESRLAKYLSVHVWSD